MATFSLSALQTFTSVHSTDPFWIGVDVHKRSYHIALLRADSKTFTFTSQASPEAFVEQLRRVNILVAEVAYEAGPTGFSLARALLAEKIPYGGRTQQDSSQRQLVPKPIGSTVSSWPTIRPKG